MKTDASDNQSMEESESAECAKSTEFLPNPLETKDESKVNKKEENDDFVFPFIQAGFGIIFMIVLLPIILVIAKNRKTKKNGQSVRS